MYTESEIFGVAVEEGILTLSLKENGLSVDLLRELCNLFERLRCDAAVAGILVTGLKSADGGDAPSSLEPASYARLGQELMFAVEGVGRPVIAVADGPTLGAALELALACDFILASASATFGFPGILRGEIPCFGGTQRLTRAVGKALAKEMIFTGIPIGAAAACAHGLVNRVSPENELMDTARGMLATICSQGLVAIRMAKEVIDAGQGLDLKRACLLERDAFALCFATEDQKEGMGSFLERRPANFKGR